MRRLLAMLAAIALLGLGAWACGGSRRGSSSAPRASSTISAASASSSATPGAGRIRGDEDDDDTPDANDPRVKLDSDLDQDHDSKENVARGYYDGDDGIVRNFGHAASAADARAITALVKRYYAAAVAADGATACALTYRFLADKIIPEDEGNNTGPAYLHGLKTCPAIMSLLFKHARSQLTAAIEVMGVRVKGSEAFALLGSSATLSEAIVVRRERGAWKIGGVLGHQLP